MTQAQIAPWLADSRWPTVPIRFLARLGTGHTPSRSVPNYWENCSIPWITLADVWQLRNGSTDVITDTKEKISELGLANSAAVKHPAGTVILSRTASVGFSAIMGADMATSQDFATWTCGPKLHPRYLLHALRAMATDLKRVAAGSTHKTIYMPDIEQLRIPAPPIEEQRRIADFLDARTARIDRLIALRNMQLSQLRERLAYLTDGAIGGDQDALFKLQVPSHTKDWQQVKLSHVCEIVTGFAFPSSSYLLDGTGTRLLRGVNVSVDSISWDDTVGWDDESFPVPARFHLRAGDLIIGMDRPWISSGMRIATLSQKDTPAFLLQRVACIRPKEKAIANYIKLALKSNHFRATVESKLTGVSIPHLSAEQIGDFTFQLPSPTTQKAISQTLENQIRKTQRLQLSIAKQNSLLAGRRQTLITAAVTGEIGVSTVGGRGVVDRPGS